MTELPECSIDIIIPYYKAASTLPRALASVAMQTTSDRITVTVADDHSEDGELEAIADKYRVIGLDVDIITLDENKGPGHARQAGLDETDGDFVFFMDADDTLEGSLALEKMLYTIINDNLDIVGGAFIEECENGVMVPHQANMIWVFGKLYRRRFLDRFLIRFNDTRANEDTGFNTLCVQLTDRIKHIPQTVYCWHFQPNTITRNNGGEYTYAHGHVGFVENMAWVYDEMVKRNLNKELIRHHVVLVLCRLYFMHEDVIAHAPEQAAASWGAILSFYIRCFQPIESAVSSGYMTKQYIEEQGEARQEYVPRMNFRSFLASLREDAKEVNTDVNDGESDI